jgi:tRNA(Ile)-lysidine synthase
MNDKVIETIRQYHLFTQGDTLTVGLSGGADSVALLYFLCGIRQEWGIGLRAAHLNHNLRGEESRRDEDFVRTLCAAWGVELHVREVDAAAQARAAGLSVEEWSREERYRFFRELAGIDGKIATAHTLSDSAETQLLNLMRGTGLKGLCGIPPQRDNIIRPLIRCTRAEVEAYCEKHGLSYVTDSSNQSDDYTRNRLRHHVLPILTEINPAYLRLAGNSLEVLRQEETYLQAQTEAAMQTLRRSDGRYDRVAFLAQPAALKGRILIEILRATGISWSYERIGRLREIIKTEGRMQVSAAYAFFCAGDAFGLEAAGARELSAEPQLYAQWDVSELRESREIVCSPGKTVKIYYTNGKEFEYLYKNEKKLLKNALDCDRIGKIVKLRGRHAGDRIALRGRGCTKSLKKLFQEAGTLPCDRWDYPVLEGESGLLWLWGFGVSESHGVTEKTKSVLLIEALEE